MENIELASIQYPGREDRIDEPPLAKFTPLADAIADAWPEIAGDSACVIFGHSMGAMLGYEVAVRLVERRSARLPAALFLSGKLPPHEPVLLPSISQLSEPNFITEVERRFGPLPEEIKAESTFLQPLLRTLRADIAVVESYGPPLNRPPLDIPIAIYGGNGDVLALPAKLAEWRAYSSRFHELHAFDGGHFYLHQEESQVLATMRADLAKLVFAPGPVRPGFPPSRVT